MRSCLLPVALLLLLLLAGAGRAQTLPGRFDSLTTAAQAQQFVRSRPGYAGFVLTDSVDQECYRLPGGLRACASAGPPAGWLKADFDGNGRTDLLLLGRRASSPYRRMLCLLAQDNRQVREVRLADALYDCATLRLCFVGGKAAIRYPHFVVPGPRFTDAASVCRVDTLIFDKTNFIEYNHASHDYRIQQVAFSATACLGICPVFELQLDERGAAAYQAGRYTEKPGRFRATVAAARVAELWGLLNYLDFPRLADDYAIAATDHATYTLTITKLFRKSGGGQFCVVEVP